MIACSSSSKIRHAAPSPTINPSLLLEKGLDACSGSLLLVESACIALNPPIPMISTADSLPPVTMTSAFPSRIWSKADAIECEELAHADVVA